MMNNNVCIKLLHALEPKYMSESGSEVLRQNPADCSQLMLQYLSGQCVGL